MKAVFINHWKSQSRKSRICFFTLFEFWVDLNKNIGLSRFISINILNFEIYFHF